VIVRAGIAGRIGASATMWGMIGSRERS